MELVDKLREESSSGHVAFTEFILKLKKKPNSLFCFFEGKNDYKYYGIRIKNIAQVEHEQIDCGGRDNVLIVYQLLKKKTEYDSVLKAFFIDNDYNPPEELNEVYCLPSYSIENQYVTDSALEQILKNEFDMSESDGDYDKVFTFCHSLFDEFHSKTELINSWLSCQNDKRRELGIKTYLKIDSTIGKYFKSLVQSNLSGISDLEDLNDLKMIENLFSEAPKVTKNEVGNKLNTFKETDQRKTFRGKFELRFFTDFLTKVQSEICKRNSSLFENRHKCSLRFEFNNSLTVLSSYADTPSTLVSYLERYKTAA